MTIKRQMFLLLWIALWHCSLFSQQPGPLITRDPQALAILNQSLTVLGSATTAGGVTAALITGHIRTTDGSSTQSYITKYQVTADAVLFRKDLTTNKGISTFASGGGKAVRILPNGKK